MTGGQRDYFDWHKPYDNPSSRLSRRLAAVQGRLREALDARDGPVRLISMCAGQGRDVIPVLAAHARRDNVDALLVELDPRNGEVATSAAREARLSRVRVRIGDAAATASYADAVPADVILACGIFGNIIEDDIRHTVDALPSLAAPGATVLWTRGRTTGHDATPQIRQWFRDAGFEEIAFDAPEADTYSVGVNRLSTTPRPFDPALTLFTFFR